MFERSLWRLARWPAGLVACVFGLSAAAMAQPAGGAAPPPGSPALRAASGLHEIQAEAWRFARLHREIATSPADAPIAVTLQSQLRASAQALVRSLHEAQPGLRVAGMEPPYHRLEGAIADLLAEGVQGRADVRLPTLGDRDAVLARMADETLGQLLQKQPQPAPRAWAELGLIGGARTGVERLAHDFEFCDPACDRALPGQAEAVERSLAALDALPRYFPATRQALVRDQWMFVRQAVRGRTNGARPAGGGDGERGRAYLIVATGHLAELLEATMLALFDKGGV